MKTKQQKLDEAIKAAEALNLKMSTAAEEAAAETDDARKSELLANMPTDQKAYDALIEEVSAIQSEIVKEKRLTEAKAFLTEPAQAAKSAGTYQPAHVEERFTQAPTIGEQIINSDAYKTSVKNGRITDTSQGGVKFGMDALGTLHQKATFGASGTGLDTTVNYINQGIVLLEQQRLTVRDLLPVGQTTQSTVKWIKEDAFTNAADMVAEEGEKPEASFDTGSASADVKKIAVVAKVTDEMWADFPMLRDYLNTRLRFMVEAKEEQQLLNGTGSGQQITGILQTSGIQTQAKGGDTNLDAIHKAMVKIRVATGTTGGFDPDGIVMHPTDYQLIRLAKDGQNQYYGGGPFYGAYGNGNTASAEPGPWGLRVVQTTAIAAGTALVGAFKMGAQIWQREGIRVDATNTNEDDFTFNRISLRVEERLALAVYRASAFCTVTSIA